MCIQNAAELVARLGSLQSFKATGLTLKNSQKNVAPTDHTSKENEKVLALHRVDPSVSNNEPSCKAAECGDMTGLTASANTGIV
jgi:hypothetical protein